MALRLHAVTSADSADHPHLTGAGARALAFRDLSAIVSDREKFAVDDIDNELANQHRAIVDAVFKNQTVLPTPAGVVFRTEHVLIRWMELHYVALTDALAFVDDRSAARVHVSRAGGGADKEAGSDLAEAASGIFRNLRRRAVASVPLTTEQVTGIVLSGAFLVERELWAEFEREFIAARDANDSLLVQLTGPWAPYDFVRMQFGD
jgi:gas vesicle protein GvpL/GvpF